MLPYPEISPVALQLGPVVIRWYSLAYLIGILSGWWVVGKLNKKNLPPVLSKQAFDDIVVWAVMGIILGGRLGFVLFYKPGYYLEHLSEIPMLWNGGMSFHGGLLGTIIAIYCFTRKYDIVFLRLMDLMAVAAPIGICLGRLANFVNGELYGRASEGYFAMVFPRDELQIPRHPSQLYEASLEGIALFIILLIISTQTNALQKKGRLSGFFLIGYSCARSVCEFFREPDNFITFLPDFITMGQLLSLPMFAVGFYLVLRSRTTVPHAA